MYQAPGAAALPAAAAGPSLNNLLGGVNHNNNNNPNNNNNSSSSSSSSSGGAAVAVVVDHQHLFAHRLDHLHHPHFHQQQPSQRLSVSLHRHHYQHHHHHHHLPALSGSQHAHHHHHGLSLATNRAVGRSGSPLPPLSSAFSSSSFSTSSSSLLLSSSSSSSSHHMPLDLSTAMCELCVPSCDCRNLVSSPASLLDLAAKVVGFNFSFQSIEQRYECIPEPVQRRVIFWSFPRNERDIWMYSSLGNDEQKVPFVKGVHLLETGCVHKVLQIGFHLSGVVTVKTSNVILTQPGSPTEVKKKFRVSITFDRCKITSVACSCETRDIFWCQHVVALALYRIRNAEQVQLRVPISETLLQLDRCQLLKMLQYLISEHYTQVLPTAQSLADQLLDRSSQLNRIDGAPDPTAGAAVDQKNCWHLNEQQVTDQVHECLKNNSYSQPNLVLALFVKVKEMLRVRDSNASRMLQLITEQFLADPRLKTLRLQNLHMPDKFRLLWEQLSSLWVCIALNPNAMESDRKRCSELLQSWTQLTFCPLEDANFRERVDSLKRKRNINMRLSDEDDADDADQVEEEDEEGEGGRDEDEGRDVGGGEENRAIFVLAQHRIVDEVFSDDDDSNDRLDAPWRRSSRRRPRARKLKSKPVIRTIFHRALEASLLRWDDGHLRSILDGKYGNGGHSVCRQSMIHSDTEMANLFSCESFPFSASSSSFPAYSACPLASCHNSTPNSSTIPFSSEPSPSSSASSSSSSSTTTFTSSSMLFNSQGCPLWNEPIPIACARVEALRSHGYHLAALRLAVAIVRSMKRKQREWQYKWQIYQSKSNSAGNFSSSGVSRVPLHCNSEGWIGNPLDPIGCLFDTLAEASLTPESKPLEHYYGIFGLEQPPTSQPTNTNSSANASSNNVIAAGHSLLEPESTSSNLDIFGFSIFANNRSAGERPRYQHISVPGSRDRSETYLSLAVESALIGLGQQRLMPTGEYAQSNHVRQEERLISRLSDVEVDTILIQVLRKQAMLLLDVGPYSGLGCGIHMNSVPMHSFARFLFCSLLKFDQDLAFSIALRAMRFPMLDSNLISQSEDVNNNLNKQDLDDGAGFDVVVGGGGGGGGVVGGHRQPMQQNLPATSQIAILSALELNQSALAASMLYAARHDVLRLKTVQKSVQRNVHSPTQLFRLAQNAFRISSPPSIESQTNSLNSRNSAFAAAAAAAVDAASAAVAAAVGHPFNILQNQNAHMAAAGSNSSAASSIDNVARLANSVRSVSTRPPDPYLLDASFELGLQVVRMTICQTDAKRREIVRWLVSCAVELGFNALMNLLQSWQSLFTPVEAVNTVAISIMSHGLVVKLGLDLQQQEDLSSAARTLALQCANEDARSCALFSLQLCESDQSAFEAVYRVVYKAGQSGDMTFVQLFSVAHYMESRGHPHQAFRLCLLAIKLVHIGQNGEAHQCVADINWTCALAHSLGKQELGSLVPLLVKNIECATILSDILRRFSVGSLSVAAAAAAAANAAAAAAAATVATSNGTTTTTTSFGSTTLNSTSGSIGSSSMQNSTSNHTSSSYFGTNNGSSAQRTISISNTAKALQVDKSPLRPLLDAAISAYIRTADNRLNHISPRHYGDFIEFLAKARETFMLAPDGSSRFVGLLEHMRRVYKGKKKLLGLIHERFN